MDRRLADAARLGDVSELHKILEDDPETLEDACLAPFSKSPLHVSALAGKADFVKEMIALVPSLATHTNKQGLIPLHMASAAGHVEAVKELLKAKIEVEQCLLKDNDGLIPLHYAVFKGKMNVIEELISHCPNSVGQVTAEGETVLHIAVKANQFEVLKRLKEKLTRLQNFRDLERIKDREGKTVRELEAVKNQLQELEIVQEDDVKLEIVQEDGNKSEVKKDYLKDPEESKTERDPKSNEVKDEASQKSSPAKEEQRHFQNTVLLVATIILTLTYQGLLNPPSTIFKNGPDMNWECLCNRKREGGKTFLKTCPAFSIVFFLFLNTAVFIQSILIIVKNLPKNRASDLRLLTLTLTFIYCVLLVASSYNSIYIAAPIYGIFIIFMIREAWHRFSHQKKQENFK